MLFALCLFACGEAPKQQNVPNLVVGIQNSPSNSLIIIASEKKFFDTTKVKVVVKEFSAGKLALQALLGQANDLDIAISAETPVVLSSLGGNQLRVLTSIVEAKNECRMVVRRENDADTPEKYFAKPRKITTSQGGSPEWITYNFFKKYNLDKNKTEIVYMLPENMPIALANKAVDGICIFDPFARIAEKELADKATTFLNTDISSYYVMSIKEQKLATSASEIEALLKGLLKAQQFIIENPIEAKKIIAQKTKLDISILDATWQNYTFKLSLTKPFLQLCEEEAKWALTTGKYPKETKVPNFSAIIAKELLKKTNPEAVDYE